MCRPLRMAVNRPRGEVGGEVGGPVVGPPVGTRKACFVPIGSARAGWRGTIIWQDAFSGRSDQRGAHAFSLCRVEPVSYTHLRAHET